MAQVNGNQLYDPFKKERVQHGTPMNPKQVMREGMMLIRKIYEANKDKPHKRENPFLVCILHREKKHADGAPLHRWANVAMTIDEYGIYPERMHGVREYAGALGNAEAMLEGNWCIATDEEEAACKKRDDAEREGALQLITQKKAGDAAIALTEMVQAVRGQQAAAPDHSAERIKELEAQLAAAKNAKPEKELVGAGASGEPVKLGKSR